MQRRVQRRRTTHQATDFCLLELPAELIIMIARRSLGIDLPTSLHLSGACHWLRDTLAAVRADAEGRRLRWLPDLASGHGVEHNGLTLTGLNNALCTNVTRRGPQTTDPSGVSASAYSATHSFGPHAGTVCCGMPASDDWHLGLEASHQC